MKAPLLDQQKGLIKEIAQHIDIKTLKAEDKDFVTTGAESDAQLRTAFKSYAKDKKLSKVLMTSFGKEVA